MDLSARYGERLRAPPGVAPGRSGSSSVPCGVRRQARAPHCVRMLTSRGRSSGGKSLNKHMSGCAARYDAVKLKGASYLGSAHRANSDRLLLKGRRQVNAGVSGSGWMVSGPGGNPSDVLRGDLNANHLSPGGVSFHQHLPSSGSNCRVALRLPLSGTRPTGNEWRFQKA